MSDMTDIPRALHRVAYEELILNVVNLTNAHLDLEIFWKEFQLHKNGISEKNQSDRVMLNMNLKTDASIAP